ncbi:DUF4396 domain-containing protein, partial [Alphaproteobacteria bacterium]|nr:DUF4396 domain-containing protein [Alphaproteobacteria bacterium]
MNFTKSDIENKINWFCLKTWKTSSKNTLWCLLGCSIGDIGTILFFQFNDIKISSLNLMILAIINGLITSILLETFILLKNMNLVESFKTAIGMSFISMISMEISMNLVDLLIAGEVKITYISIIPMLVAGFITPLPYNY